jgi:hypothetical protein
MRAWDEGLDFRALVRSDAEIAARVDLAAVFDLGSDLAHKIDAHAADHDHHHHDGHDHHHHHDYYHH